MTDKDDQLSLEDLRQRIDELDVEILQRLNERASCALEVAESRSLTSAISSAQDARSFSL